MGDPVSESRRLRRAALKAREEAQRLRNATRQNAEEARRLAAELARTRQQDRMRR